MAVNEYGNPFSVCFNMMKIRYNEYDKSIDGTGFISPTDKVNVFINLESVLSNISRIKDIDRKLILERDFNIILVSEALNLCAHYKRFFRGNGLETRIFLYYTDLKSEDFKNYIYNDEFRSYYTNKYMNNPRYSILGDGIVKNVSPELKTMSDFINNIYFINTTNIDSSLVPYTVWSHDKSYKNFIITGDMCDTQYQLLPENFMVHYIRKSMEGTALCNDFNKSITNIFKASPDVVPELQVFNNPAMYSLLIACTGDKKRSLEGVKGVGVKSVLKFILSGINDGLITSNTNNINLLEKIFPEEMREQIVSNFNCVSINSQFSEMSDKDIFDITNQIIDRFDNNSLITLNNTRYSKYPLMLPELTC